MFGARDEGQIKSGLLLPFENHFLRSLTLQKDRVGMSAP